MLRLRILSIFSCGFFLLGIGQTFGREEESKLIEGAKKEGKVVFWSTGLTPPLAKAIEEGFKKRYGLPKNFEVVFAPLRTTEIMAKLIYELKAQRLTVDIISGPMPEFFYDLLRAGELMKYESPEYKHFPDTKGLCSEPGYWVATCSMSFVPMWNPKFVKKDLTTYADLLDPQFKGMIVSGDPIKSESYLMTYIGLRKILDRDFMVKLAKQDIAWYTRSPDLTTKVVTGERPVAFMGNNRTASVAAAEVTEIKVLFPKEGVVMLTSPYILLAKAPRPNSAKLFVDYVNSWEGQKLKVDMSGYFAGREDVPIPPRLLEFTPPASKIKIIPMDWRSLTEKDIQEARKEFQEIFGK